jgi:hypothetical protein
MKQTFKPLVGFGPTVPAGEPPQTHAIDPAATGIGIPAYLTFKKLCSLPLQCGHVLRTILITEIIFLKCISLLLFMTEIQ